jgi:hypothetical protein
MKKILFVLSLVLFTACDANISDSGEQTEMDVFAACVTESGATFYGTEWCSHCKNQKALFGSSMSEIEFVDCDVSRVVCRKEGITGYPTWIFGDGSRVSGRQPLATLAEKSNCTLPGGEDTEPTEEVNAEA